MAYIIKSDSTIVQLPIGKKYSLHELQAVVGGYIELIPGSGGRAYCNEDGKRLKLPINERASAQFMQHLVGDVIILEAGDR